MKDRLAVNVRAIMQSIGRSKTGCEVARSCGGAMTAMGIGEDTLVGKSQRTTNLAMKLLKVSRSAYILTIKAPEL